MNLNHLSYTHIISIADTWKSMGGNSKIEIGALEPLLWRDGKYYIHDIVKALTERGFEVSITTNGQLLDLYAKNLSDAGLSLIRTSWHSSNPLVFREISGGYGNYSRFKRGVILALESGIKMSFNRVLHKGYTDDIPEQLSFIEHYGSRLKFYTLLWTPQNVSTYKLFYQDWRPIVRQLVLPRTLKIKRIKKQLGRGRLKFILVRNSSVEVKLGNNLNREVYPCKTCSFKNECEEGFGDYVRVDPRLHLYFCYMRRDLGFKIQNYLNKPGVLKHKIQKILGVININHLLTAAPLRLTITPFCNFNCRAPGVQQGWCVEESGEFKYPKIRESLI